MDIALFVLAVMAIAGLATVVLRSALGASVLIVGSVVWIFVNAPMEGAVLWTVAPGHGLTSSDLLAPLGVLIGAARLWSLRPRAVTN